MKCPSCGKFIQDINNYCPFCGNRLIRGLASNFIDVSNASNETVGGTLSVIDDVTASGVKPGYLDELTKLRDDALEAHHRLTEYTIQWARTNEKAAMEQMKEKTLRETRARKIQLKIVAINAFFDKITSQKLFREDIPSFFTELPMECIDYKDFKNKIESLCCIFEIELDGLRSLISNPDDSWRSRRLLKEWLKENGVTNFENTIDEWDKICCLRNMPPTHPRISSEHIESIIHFGGDLDNLPKLWDNILNHFLNSLNKFYEIIYSLSSTKSS